MKQKLNILVIIFLTSFSCSVENSQTVEKENDLIKYNLKGPVKSITTLNYNIIEKEGGITKGNAVLGMPYDNIDLNEQGFINSTLFGTDSSEIFTLIMEYDHNNNLIQRNKIENGKYSDFTLFYYNNSNKLIKEDWYISEKTIQRHKELKYFGRIVKQVSYFKGQLESVQILLLDKCENISREYIKDFLNPYKKNLKYYYNDQNLVLDCNHLINNAIEFTISYTYDSLNNIILEEGVHYDGEFGYAHKYEYKFDNYGNWIERITFKDYGDGFSPDLIKTRKIEYYN